MSETCGRRDNGNLSRSLFGGGGEGESREIKRMVVEHRGSACCSRRFARPVRVRELLDAGKKMGVVIRFDNGLR